MECEDSDLAAKLHGEIAVYYKRPMSAQEEKDAEAKEISLESSASWSDTYYFSAITQLAIGYGDIKPKGWLRHVAAIQGILGFLYGLIVLTRFIAFLPRSESVGDATLNRKEGL